MTTATSPPRAAPHPQRPWPPARTALTARIARAVKTVGAARRRDWSPALTVAGLGCLDTAAWVAFGWGAAWVALGLSLLALDLSRERRP